MINETWYQAQKVDRLRTLTPSLAGVPLGKATELDQLGLARLQGISFTVAAIPGHRTSCAFQGAIPPGADIRDRTSAFWNFVGCTLRWGRSGWWRGRSPVTHCGSRTTTAKVWKFARLAICGEHIASKQGCDKPARDIEDRANHELSLIGQQPQRGGCGVAKLVCSSQPLSPSLVDHE